MTWVHLIESPINGGKPRGTPATSPPDHSTPVVSKELLHVVEAFKGFREIGRNHLAIETAML